MKLLLTSGGLTNESIAKALFELVGKKAEDTKLAFVPTAMNFEDGDKSWFINDLANFKRHGIGFIDIVDISALPREVWEPRLRRADVLFFSGGTTPHLMYWLKKSGLDALLSELLETRVYAGISAGSLAATPSIILSRKEKLDRYKEMTGYENTDGLGLVPFYLRPHFNSPTFLHATREAIEEAAKTIKEPIYALDDQSALKVVDGNVEVISEGEWLLFNE